MRILFLDQFSEWGGAQLCLRDVLAEVRDRGWEAEVMAPGEGPLLQYARERGFETEQLPLSHYTNGRKTAADLACFPVDVARAMRIVRRVLGRRPADLIYVNGPRALPSVWGTPLPVVFHSHSLLGKAYERAIAALSLRGCRAKVLACSRFVAKPMRDMGTGDAVQVIYNGVPDHGFRPRPVGETPLEVGIIGRIAPEKGHLDFVRAARLLAGTQPMRFTAVGTALFSNPHYERAVRTLGAASRTRFTGWTEDVGRALHGLDVLAVPSTAVEASPRVILEAFSAGTCVVAYPSGGIPELIRDGYNGLLAMSRSPESLAQSIQTLAANPGLRARLVENGRREWETRFQVARFRRDTCDAISRAVTSPERAATGFRSTTLTAESARDSTLSSR